MGLFSVGAENGLLFFLGLLHANYLLSLHRKPELRTGSLHKDFLLARAEQPLAVFQSCSVKRPFIGVVESPFLIKNVVESSLDGEILRVTEWGKKRVYERMLLLTIARSGSSVPFPARTHTILLCFHLADRLLVRGGPPGHPTQGVSLCQLFHDCHSCSGRRSVTSWDAHWGNLLMGMIG